MTDGGGREEPEAIAALRGALDQASGELVEVLERRFALVRAIGREKRRLGLPFRDAEREDALIERLAARSGEAVPPDALRQILRVVFDASVRAMEAEDAEAP